MRRQSYELNDKGLFDVEYADVFGIPFDFTAKPVITKPKQPPIITRVKSLPERRASEIRFPHVRGYRVELPNDTLQATFTDESILTLTPELIGPTRTDNQGIIGESVEMNLKHTARDTRPSTIYMELTGRLLQHWTKSGQEPPKALFGNLKKLVRQWVSQCLICQGDTYPAQLLIPQISERACDLITAAIVKSSLSREGENRHVTVLLDPYSPEGSTRDVNFSTSKTELWSTSPNHCHVNYAVLDSSWEGEFCRILEHHHRVVSYVKNHALGFEVPYTCNGESRTYRPDFIVRLLDDHGPDDLLNLVVEIKGRLRDDVPQKNLAMETYWIPGVNHQRQFGRWAYAMLDDVFEMEADLNRNLEARVNLMLDQAIRRSRNTPAHP